MLLKQKFEILTCTVLYTSKSQNYRTPSYRNSDGSPYRNFATFSLDNNTMEILIAIPQRYHTLLWIEAPIAHYAGN
jgi:hypothetical protein